MINKKWRLIILSLALMTACSFPTLGALDENAPGDEEPDAADLQSSIVQFTDPGTYYIRTDGGSAEECSGLVDSPYPGSGNNQDCAWNHPFAAFPPMETARIAGGSTVIIASGSYRMGFGAPGSDACEREGAYDCVMAAVPSGANPGNPTRILGAGWDAGCHQAPELWGAERPWFILNLTDSSNVEVGCLEITDHSECIEAHTGDLACEYDQAPFGDWAMTGLYAEDSSRVYLHQLDIHGLANSGIHAGRLTDWVVEDVRIAFNGWAGWDGDLWDELGDENHGTMTFRRFVVEWNGCSETGGEPTGCWGQSAGGYGDGFAPGETGGDWLFEDSAFLHNTSDGVDMLYHTLGGSSVFNRVHAEGNAGNQIKVTGAAEITNSLIISNCTFFEGKPFTHELEPCRALGNTLHLVFMGGEQVTILNSSLYGQGDGLIMAGPHEDSGSCNGSESITAHNNLFIGDTDYSDPTDIAFLFYQEGCGNLKLEGDHNIAYGVKNTEQEWADPPFPGSHNRLEDPMVEGPLSGEAFGMQLSSGSPAVDLAEDSLCPAVDLLGGPRPVDGDGDGEPVCDAGAYEYVP